jgi:site-specific recombinase XerD
MSEKTIDSSARAVTRLAGYFDKCPDTLNEQDLKTYFDHLVEIRSWSTVNVDRCGLQFFWKHVLNKEWKWVNIIKPPIIRTIPDILTVKETENVINKVKKARYRVFLFALYSMGMRLGECLSIKVSDMDSRKMQVHISNAKGRKDRLVPLPEMTLKALRSYWKTHRNPVMIFPNLNGNSEKIKATSRHMDYEGPQQALKAALKDCGISKRITIHSLRHGFASHLVEAGVQLRLSRNISGTSIREPPALYTQISDVSYQNRSQEINRLITDSKSI